MSTHGDKIPQTGEEQIEQPSQEPPSDELVLRVPETARIPEGATFYDGPDDTRCRVITAAGTRCRATRVRAHGLCPGHAGRGGVSADPSGYSQLGHEAKRRRSHARATLGITTRRAAQPLQQARVAAQMRAEDYARAVVDAPLDDPDLGTIPRQQAAIRALELLYPQVTATVDVSMPIEPDQVAAMGWQEMQQLAQDLTE